MSEPTPPTPRRTLGDSLTLHTLIVGALILLMLIRCSWSAK
ncbi:MAG: hypothetical protein R3E89_19190 [Thiolinea sp.]